jgi:hypothetical protein
MSDDTPTATQLAVDAIINTVKAALAPRDEKIAALEADLTALRLLVEADQAARDREPVP